MSLVFIQTSCFATTGGLNGPNELLFITDNIICLTTEGSVAVNGKIIFPGLPSQILCYNTQSKQKFIFVESAKPWNATLGSSLLGIIFKRFSSNQQIITTDYFNNIRVYSLEGYLVRTLATNYTAGNCIGNLFETDDFLYVTGFDPSAGDIGVILRYNRNTETDGTIFIEPTPLLNRPIGLLELSI